MFDFLIFLGVGRLVCVGITTLSDIPFELSLYQLHEAPNLEGGLYAADGDLIL